MDGVICGTSLSGPYMIDDGYVSYLVVVVVALCGDVGIVDSGSCDVERE
jgi:hypothetical protein